MHLVILLQRANQGIGLLEAGHSAPSARNSQTRIELCFRATVGYVIVASRGALCALIITALLSKSK